MPSSLLHIGDVLKTNPIDGYWGCAVVLTERESTSQLDPMCHIAIATTVFRRDFTFDDLNLSQLEVLVFERGVRVAPQTYVPRIETCIGVYSRKRNPLPILGKVDPQSVFSDPLAFVAGDGTDGGWPFCGNVTPILGNEAVHAWRAEHDTEAYNREVAEAEASHEAVLDRLKRSRK